MTWRTTIWLPAFCLAAGAAAAAAAAEPPETRAAPRPPATGEATRLWLDRQRQGAQASASAQPLSGPVQEQVFERYRKSFSQPIPRRFEREQLESGGAR